MSISGKNLLEIILLAGLQDERPADIRREFLMLGFDVPRGSLSRALSQARGTWQGGGFGFTAGDAYFRKGDRAYLEDIEEYITYSTPQGIISGADMLQFMPHEALEYGLSNKPENIINAIIEKRDDDEGIGGALGRGYYGLIDFFYMKQGGDSDAIALAQSLILEMEIFINEYFPANEVIEVPVGELSLSEAIGIVLS